MAGRSWLLVLEDEPEARLFYTELIAHHPSSIGGACEVVSAASIEEAMSVLDSRPDPPVGAVLDRWLPDGDGRVIAERLAERIPASHIVVVSGDDRIATALGSWSMGATHMLKPVDVALLVRHLGMIIGASVV